MTRNRTKQEQLVMNPTKVVTLGNSPNQGLKRVSNALAGSSMKKTKTNTKRVKNTLTKMIPYSLRKRTSKVGKSKR